jgi:hypothetical protein
MFEVMSLIVFAAHVAILPCPSLLEPYGHHLSAYSLVFYLASGHLGCRFGDLF